MSTNVSEVQETILKAVDVIINQRNNELKLDKTITGIVKKNIGIRNGKPLYQVEYNGGYIDAIAQSAADSYTPHTAVYVMIPQSDFSKEKIIIGRASTISTDRSNSIVAAAINRYSITGANLINSLNEDNNIKDITYGLRSYHSIDEELINSNSINHRAQLLYGGDSDLISFNTKNFNIYKEESTAIMIKADFMTNLSSQQKQQTNARYGLIFNFSVNNLNKGYGETQGEILENVGNIVKGTVVDENNDLITTTFNEYVDNYIFKNYWESNMISTWTDGNIGLLDIAIERTKAIYEAFQASSADEDIDIVANTIKAYLALLNELQGSTSVEDIRNRYLEWKATEIGDGEEKIEQFVLTSDDMIGNPFNFKKWNTQYAVFQIDLKDFNSLDSIVFFQQGFVSNSDYELQWPPSVFGGSDDIFVKNLQIYTLNPLDNQSGNYTLKVEPSNGMDIVLNSKNDTTYFQATMLRMLSENLTYNEKVAYYWFKEDSTQKTNSYPAGIGWKNINNNAGNKSVFKTELKDNKAYKNVYKCVAIYEPASDDKVILNYTFSVYNEDAKIDMKLESDLGTEFSFDAGSPTIKVLINTDRIAADNFEEKCYLTDENPEYRYIWCVEDSTNNEPIFLDDQFELLNNENVSIENIMLINAKQNLLRKIKAYTLSDEGELQEIIDPYRATRIKYPVSIMSSGFTITCYLQHYDSGKYYDIGSSSLTFTNQDTSIISDYRIQIINGDQVFQYDEYGNTPCAEKNKNPLEIKPLQAKLFAPSGVEVEGTNYQVEWIFPIENTMISTNETLKVNPATDLVQSYVNQNVSFNIANLYNPDAYANQITCHIYFNNKDYYKDTNFYFGKQGGNGTNGTDMIAKIEYVGNDINNILRTQPLTLYVQKENSEAIDDEILDKEETAKGMFNTGSSLTKNCVLTAAEGTEFAEENLLKVTLYQKGIALGTDNFALGYPRWNIAGNYKSESKNTVAKFFTIDDNGQTIIWNYDTNNKDDKNYYRMQNLKVSVKTTLDDQMYYAFFSLPIIEYEYIENNLTVDQLLKKNRISIDKNYYLNEIVYNADGRNPIYNHNQGLRLYNIPSNITRIEWTVAGGLNEEENEPSISLLEEKNSRNSVSFLETIPQDNASMVYILPNDIFDGSITNNRIEAKLFENDILIATVYAPIYMSLNTFGLASLNAWDGNTVTIDEEGGYVIAPQVGAGEKDDNNRFTGILMGKTETYTGGGDNEKQTGLFGYSHGLQSIFLDSNTGNATFGLPDGYIFDRTSGIPVPKHVSNDYNEDNDYNENNEDDDYNEGRIELIPGGVSKIGGWRLGRRSLYYTKSGKIGPRYHNDYVPDIKTGKIKSIKPEPYSSHHEKDIDYEDSGILLHSGDDPYISIKGRQLTEADIDPADLNNYLRPNDSLEIQLDPKAPTLFTIFRHNGSAWIKHYLDEEGAIQTAELYAAGTRTYLAGINGKGEFVANTVSSIIQTNDEPDSIYTTQFSVNSFRAFNDIKNAGIEVPNHTGLRIKVGSNILGQLFISNTGLDPTIKEDEDHDPTLYLTGGLTDSDGEYARPISLHGKYINLFAKDSTQLSGKFKHTDANLNLQTNSFETNIGDSTFKLFRNWDNENPSNLMSANTLKINAGIQSSGKAKEYYYLTDGTKIEKRNIETYIGWFDSLGNINYAKNNSWDKNIVYVNTESSNSEYFVPIENYPICYKVNGRDEYCTLDDFENIFYRIKNLPKSVNENNEYVLEDFLKENRYTKNSDNIYEKVSDDQLYSIDQYLRIEKTIENQEQAYIYVLKENLKIDQRYALYDNNKYVYNTNTIYCKVNDNYILQSSLKSIQPKIKDFETNKYYDINAIDFNDIYYNYENNYIPFNIINTRYVKNPPIEIFEPVLDGNGNPTYDENNELIVEKREEDGGYRLYNEDTDVIEDTYILYNNVYIKISQINLNNTYVKLNNENEDEWILRSNLIEKIYTINNNDFSELEFEEILNTIYYNVKNNDNNEEYYLSKETFNSLSFDYWYSITEINESHYISQQDVTLDNFYNLEEDGTYQLDDNGSYYRTSILDPSKEGIYEYISLDSNNSVSIDFNSPYYSNSLYPLNPWRQHNNISLSTEETYVYHLEDNNLTIEKLIDLTTYYSVRDVHNELHYISQNFLDNYTGDLYIYDDENFKEIIQNSEEEEEEQPTIVSTQAYELYAGSYFGKITTNKLNNNYIELKADNTGINLFNSSGPISISSENSDFKLKLNSGGEISFGGNSPTLFKEEPIKSKFVIDKNDNGLSLTSNWLRLKSNNYMTIESPQTFSLICSNIGPSTNSYTVDNPQIILRAGSNNSILPGQNKATGSAVELILNSSNNGWISAIKGKNIADRVRWPVFAVRTRYSQISILPEIFSSGGLNNLYRENFYVRMPQYNTEGLSVQGNLPSTSLLEWGKTKDNKPAYAGIGLNVTNIIKAKGFKGDGRYVTNTCSGQSTPTSSENAKNKTISLKTTIGGVGNSGIIYYPAVTITDGRPVFSTRSLTVSIPDATAIYNAISGSIADQIATALSNSNFALKSDLNNYVTTTAFNRHAHLVGYNQSFNVSVDGKLVGDIVRKLNNSGAGSAVRTTTPN